METGELLEQVHKALRQVRSGGSSAELAQATAVLKELRDQRQFAAMLELGEAIRRRAPEDAGARRLYAQALIERGMATVAIDVLQPLTRLSPQDSEYAEAMGLTGRAYKQIFLDAANKTAPFALQALRQSIVSYHRLFDQDPIRNTWHGVNLLALLARARRLGVSDLDAPPTAVVAQQLVSVLRAVPEDQRDEWYLPTLAEAALGRGDWPSVERVLHQYVADSNAKAFLIASTLRQFTQVWDIESIDPRGRALAEILRARLLSLSHGELVLTPESVLRARQQQEPSQGQLEAILGVDGTKTWRWYRTGLERASAVCSVRAKLADRVGTGWLVRADSLGLTPPDELLVVTNYHVVNAHGVHPGIGPENAEVVFESVDGNKAYAVKEIVWSSPADMHDCVVLRLEEKVDGIAPLPLAKSLPSIGASARVYVIGHPKGGELAFSLQDNALIDHEGQPAGKPPIPGVIRVHYRAPTAPGSSGSPVFNAELWQVVALHHMGGKTGVQKLNGQAGSYEANEGIALTSIVSAMIDGGADFGTLSRQPNHRVKPT